MVRIGKELVLAAGAVNSPQLLQLSGIGDPDILKRHGIDIVHALPKVGEDLQGHLGLNAVSFVLMVGSCLLALISVLVQRERETGKET